VVTNNGGLGQMKLEKLEQWSDFSSVVPEQVNTNQYTYLPCPSL
jgi:hypothetical protein